MNEPSTTWGDLSETRPADGFATLQGEGIDIRPNMSWKYNAEGNRPAMMFHFVPAAARMNPARPELDALPVADVSR